MIKNKGNPNRVQTVAAMPLEKKEIETVSIFKLIVRTPFRNYKKGDVITSKKEIEKILNSPEALMIIKTVN